MGEGKHAHKCKRYLAPALVGGAASPRGIEAVHERRHIATQPTQMLLGYASLARGKANGRASQGRVNVKGEQMVGGGHVKEERMVGGWGSRERRARGITGEGTNHQ